MPYAVALVVQGAAMQQEAQIRLSQWTALWQEYVCKLTITAKEYDHPRKGKRMHFKFVGACKKKAIDSLSELRSIRYSKIVSSREWGVGCVYIMIPVGRTTPVCLLSRVNSLDAGQIGTPERMGLVAEWRELVLHHVPQ